MNPDVSGLLESLPSARWFGGKGRPIRDLEILDLGVVEDGPPALVIAIVRVGFADGGSEQLYHLPLIVDEGIGRDALDEPDRLSVLGDLMAHGTSIKGSHGVFQFSGPGLDPLSPPGSGSVRVMTAEQSNSALVLDEQVFVKLFRGVEIGINPDLELTRLLTNESFQHIPLHLGEISYEGEIEEEEISIDLGIAQQYMPDATEGWDRTLEYLGHFYDEVSDLDAPEDMRFLTEERAQEILRSIDDLGDVTALLHITLSRSEADPDTIAETIDRFELDEWADRAGRSLTTLQQKVPELAAMSGPITERIDRLRDLEDAGAKIRIHGDYHLGQALFSSRGWMILDFEGEPARPLEDRRAKQSALRDVAGILRSFNYAAVATLFQRTEPGSEEWQRLEPWALVWETVARDRFLHAYLTRSHEGSFLPQDRETVMRMLDVFEIDKALYELGYEIAHRPDWIRIPLRGITQVLEREPTA